MMKEIRQDCNDGEKFTLVLDWSFFDNIEPRENISDYKVLLNIVEHLEKGESLILSSGDTERSDRVVKQLNEKSDEKGVNVQIYKEGYYIDPEVFREQKPSSNPETLG